MWQGHVHAVDRTGDDNSLPGHVVGVFGVRWEGVREIESVCLCVLSKG